MCYPEFIILTSVICIEKALKGTSTVYVQNYKLSSHRVKKLREPVYTHKESEAAGGLGVYSPLVKPPKVQSVLQPASNRDNVAVDIGGLSLSELSI